MKQKPFVPWMVFLLLAISVQTSLAQTSVSGATSAQQAQSDKTGKLADDDPMQYAYSDNFAALMVTLVFFGLFAVFYMAIRNKPSERELKKIRKKHKL